MNAPKFGLSWHQISDLGVLVALAILVAFYLVDSYQASNHVYNLIFVLPVAVLVLALCGFAFIQQLRDRSRPPEGLEPLSSVMPVIGLFAGYVMTLEWLGFDVGTALFISVFLYLHGERRWPWLLGYGIAFGFLIAWFFSVMLPYPMPMLALPTEY